MTSESEMEVKFHHLRLANNNQNRNAKETLLTLVREKLVIEKSETCPSWLSKLPPIPPNELHNILTTYTSSFEDFAQHTEDIESDLKYAAVETLSKRCVQIYILILQKNFNEVGSILLEAYNLTDYCITQKYFSHEYADGFRFVLKTLEIFWTIENEKEVEKLNVETLARYVEDLNGFEKLNVKNKVGVLALKVYFLGKIIRGKSYEEQIEIVKQIIDMDPNNSEWHVCHYFLSKFLRVSIDTYGPPSEQEKNAILAAVELQEKEELDSRILIGQITCLAEILRNDLKNNVPLQFGKHSFDSADEVVQFIKMEAEKIVSIDPISVRSNVNLAKIFSSILPFQVQDRDFAKTCIERAVQYYPNSSKANHRMGVFYLSSTTGIEQALGYMKKAYETDQRNIFAVLDLLRIYMGDVDKNEQELKDTFHTAVSSKFFQGVPKNFSDLLFTKAIYEFLRGREIECVDLLLEAQGTDEKAKEFFKEVYRFVKRFKWYQNLNGKNILGRIQQLLASSLNEGNYSVDSVRKRQLKELCEAAKIAQDSIKVNTGFAGRGRGGLRISSGIETESRERMGLEFVSEGSRGRSGYIPRGFTGRGSRRGRGQEGPRGRGIFPRNTDNNYHSNINAHRDDDANSNWRSGDNQHPQSVKTADHEIVTTRPPLSPSVCSKGSIKDETQEPELPGIVFRTTQQDHHQTLGVAKTATKAEMKKVYLKLAREYHPDRNTHLSEIDREAKQKQMERINEAWDFLQRMSN